MNEYLNNTIKFWEAFLNNDKDKVNDLNRLLCIQYSKMSSEQKEKVLTEINHSEIIEKIKSKK